MRALLAVVSLAISLPLVACQADEVGDGPKRTNSQDGDETASSSSGGGGTQDPSGGVARPVDGNQPTNGTPGPAGSMAGGFRVITPVRLVDSRDGTGAAKGTFNGALESNVERSIDVSGLDELLGPAATRVGLQLNVTATETSGDGFLRVYPCGTAPDVSMLTFRAGDTVAGTTIVDAKTSFCVLSNVATRLIVDATGAFEQGAGLRVTPNAPLRLFDSREGAKGTAYTIPLSGAAAGASGVIAHVTITEPAAAGFARVFPCGTPEPQTSTINFAAGDTIATTTVVAVSNGSLCVSSSTAAHVLIDVEGSLRSDGKVAFVPRVPTRIHDSRTDGGPASAFRLKVPNFAPGMTTAAIHLTGAEAQAPGFISADDCSNGGGTSNSSVNFAANQVRTSLSFVPISADGTVCVTASTPVQLIADLVGVLAP